MASTKSTSANAGNPILDQLVLDSNSFENLMEIAGQALRLDPPRYVSSIFGSPLTWLPPHRKFSEYNIVNPWRYSQFVRYLLDVTLPALASSPPDLPRTLFPPAVTRRVWRPTTFYRQPDVYGSVSSFPDEHWFFINGVATNEDMARFNSSFLAHMFHRPLTVVQNATDSLPLDLVECAVGKEIRVHPVYPDRKTFTEPALWATAAILEAVNSKDTRRVVVIAHSQGTIIMANVLRALTGARAEGAPNTTEGWHNCVRGLMGVPKLQMHRILHDNLASVLATFAANDAEKPHKGLDKLEIYTFANCADRMTYCPARSGRPYMEHFANERDIVARLGVLSPMRDNDSGPIRIEGPLFEQSGAWGHLLNEHYLSAMHDYLNRCPDDRQGDDGPFQFTGKHGLTPRLYDYFLGQSPRRSGTSSGSTRRRDRAA